MIWPRVNPELVAQWDYDKNDKTHKDFTAHSDYKAWWKSSTGLSWQAAIKSRNKGSGEPYLCGKRPIPGKTDLVTVNPELVAQWDYDKNKKTPKDYTAYSNKKVWWKNSCRLSL